MILHPNFIDTCEMINDTARLLEVTGFLADETELALDLEMDSLHHYREKICLIQIATRAGRWLIDPLALKDLSALSKLLKSDDTLIVIHGADYDIRSLHRDFGIEIGNLFDTMIAARFLGHAEFGLAVLLKTQFGVELDKRYQKSDWSKRPLPPEMLAYAAADVAYLLRLYDQLQEDLISQGRLEWLQEECALVCATRLIEKEGPLFLSCKGAAKLDGRSLAILDNLLQLRDFWANKLDRPLFKVFSVETLIEIAEKKPKNSDELSAIKGISPGQIKRYADRILSIIASCLNLLEAKLPSFPRNVRTEPCEKAKKRLKSLKLWRKEKSVSLTLDPGVIAPNWLLERIASVGPVAPEDLNNITGMRDWQKGAYGAEILAVMKQEDESISNNLKL